MTMLRRALAGLLAAVMLAPPAFAAPTSKPKPRQGARPTARTTAKTPAQPKRKATAQRPVAPKLAALPHRGKRVLPRYFDNRQLVKLASRFLGVPYVYGGESPGGFDCSGLVAYVFAKHKINLPHRADLQYDYGRSIPKHELKPGDLVFFRDWGGGNFIGHVGIYAGNGQFIHASSGATHAVTVSPLWGYGYRERYWGAKRIERKLV